MLPDRAPARARSLVRSPCHALGLAPRCSLAQVWDLFDLIGGTSTGGMLALALAAHRSLEDIALQYHLLRSQYEGQSAVWSEVRRFAVGASHDTDRAEAALRSFFGDVKFAELPLSPKVFVTTANVDSFPAQPYLMRSYELVAEARRRTHFLGTSNVSLYEAARATTSAPTFVSPPPRCAAQRTCALRTRARERTSAH
jgi:patatin-like phospholipase/acyl hydrolase